MEGNSFIIDEIKFNEGTRAGGNFSDLVSCSCDPNDKYVDPVGCGPNGNISKKQKLTYTIHFTNTGSTNAHKVILRDFINSNLDINSFKFLNSSHAVSYIQIIPQHILIVEFDSIELAHGISAFISLSDLNSYVANGYCIEKCVVESRLSNISQFKELNIEISPNPSSDYCMLKLKGTLNGKEKIFVALYNYSGILVKQMNFDPNEFKKDSDDFNFQHLLNTKQLPAGLYLLEFTYVGERKLMSNKK